MTRIERDRIEDLGFSVWQDMQSAEFHILLAYKHGAEECLRKGIETLRKAIDAAEAKLDADDSVSANDTRGIMAERRAREMIAELPEDQREILRIKGMIG